MVFLRLIRILSISLILQLYLITLYYRRYSLTLVVLSFYYNIILNAIRPYTSILSILLIYSLIYPFPQPCLVLVNRF